jgi:hypothetical protein
MSSRPIFELTRKLRRALKSGGRLHLDPQEVLVLLDEDIFEAISRREAEELRKSCVPVIAAGTNSAVSGSTKGPTPDTGSSAGSTTEASALARGARARLLQAVEEISPRKLQSMHLQPTT